jgi:hypothetical protein
MDDDGEATVADGRFVCHVRTIRSGVINGSAVQAFSGSSTHLLFVPDYRSCYIAIVS